MVSQMTKKFPAFVEPKDSLSCSQESDSGQGLMHPVHIVTSLLL
jgi:hypothetical protein